MCSCIINARLFIRIKKAVIDQRTLQTSGKKSENDINNVRTHKRKGAKILTMVSLGGTVTCLLLQTSQFFFL